MATTKQKALQPPVLPETGGSYLRDFWEPTGKDIVLDDAVNRAQWDPKTGKVMYIMENGEWVELLVDENGELLPNIPYRTTPPEKKTP